MYNGTISDLENIVTNLMQQNAVANSTRLTENMLLVAFNNTRRAAERNWDFYYSQVNTSIDIPSTGAAISANYIGLNTVTVTGTLSPNVTGAWSNIGDFEGYPLFSKTVGGVDYYLIFRGTGWEISTNIVSGATNKWTLATTSDIPTGTYTASGSYTGSPVVTANFATADIKRIEYVSLPVRGGGMQPIEYLDNDTWIARVKRQVGRQNFNPTMSLADLGVFYPNPLVYQNGQTLFLQPPDQFTFPVVGVGLNVTQFLPDYTTGSTDFFVQNAPDFLQWGACLEINRLWKEFVNRQEGNISDTQIQENYRYAWEALIRWDISVQGGMANQLPIPPPPQIYAQAEPQAA